MAAEEYGIQTEVLVWIYVILGSKQIVMALMGCIMSLLTVGVHRMQLYPPYCGGVPCAIQYTQGLYIK
jgi:hypothetical protein